MDAIFHRTSIRKYQETPVEAEKIETLLRAAMAAPSACNQQPWEFYVVRNKEKIKELSEASPYAGCAKGAPVVFVPCYRKNCQVPMYAEIDLSAAVENLLLEADSLGLGAVWMGIAPQKDRMVDVRKVLDIPGELEPFALVPCGYPAQERTQEDRYEVERVHYVDFSFIYEILLLFTHHCPARCFGMNMPKSHRQRRVSLDFCLYCGGTEQLQTDLICLK